MIDTVESYQWLQENGLIVPLNSNDSSKTLVNQYVISIEPRIQILSSFGTDSRCPSHASRPNIELAWRSTENLLRRIFHKSNVLLDFPVGSTSYTYHLHRGAHSSKYMAFQPRIIAVSRCHKDTGFDCAEPAMTRAGPTLTTTSHGAIERDLDHEILRYATTESTRLVLSSNGLLGGINNICDRAQWLLIQDWI